MKKILAILLIAILTMGVSFAEAESLKIPEAGKTLMLPSSLTSIKAEAFQGNTTFEAVTFGENVEQIGAAAFSGCSNLRLVTFGNPDTVIAETEDASQEAAFQGCSDSLVFIADREGNVSSYAQSHEILFGTQISTYRAVLIGNNYEDLAGTVYAGNVLNGCIEDACYYMTPMLNLLKVNPFETYTVPDVTEKEFREAISTGFADSSTGTPYDVSLFYYSGHGAEGGKLLCTNYFTAERSSAISNDGMITASELKTLLDKVPGQKIVIVDACYSGALINRGEEADVDSFTEDFLSAFSEDGLESRAGELGKSDYFVITACSKDEKSYNMKSGDRWYGAMTYGLMQGMGFDRLGEDNGMYFCTRTNEICADSDGDGKLTFAELAAYIPKKVKDMMRNSDYTQSVKVWPASTSESATFTDVVFIP